MHTRRIAIYLLLLALATASAGCQTGQPTDESAAAAPAPTEPASPEPEPTATVASEPVPVALGEYDRVWAAAVDVLRDWQFVVNRRDRRFGVISTEPQPASTFIEPWRPDHSRTGRLAESSVNHQRRTVRITMTPVAADAVAAAGDNPAATPYRMAVIVSVDRRHHPPRQLTTAAVGRLQIASAHERFRPIFTEQGRQETFWEPVGRDAEFERHLATAILHRAGERFATPAAAPAP